VPNIYHPHDLLYHHLPHVIPPRERVKRDVMLRSFCHAADLVSVTSSWVKRDVMRQFALPDEKVAVVPLTGSLTAYPAPTPQDLSATRDKFRLPDAYVFYPAQTWPHKNHAVLLEALAILRDRNGLVVPLVSSGRQDDHYPALLRKVRDLRLDGRVQFLGFVTPIELQCLYRLCRCVAIPTLFEAASGPLNEAFMAGAPAACSNVTSLPEQAGDSALVFDPHRPDHIADAILRLWTDPALRQTLIERGRANVARFTWAKTARHFRAHYRKLGNRPLTDEDRERLTAPPLI
jgi:glycosyltransferase involved in cell wall biosynthesis